MNLERNMTIKIEDNEYKLIKNYRDGYDEELFKEKYTSYFESYDYIFVSVQKYQ